MPISGSVLTRRVKRHRHIRTGRGVTYSSGSLIGCLAIPDIQGRGAKKPHVFGVLIDQSKLDSGARLTIKNKPMSKVFRVTPKRIKRTNGTVLTPEMAVTVTTAIHTINPFSNGAKEIQEAYMRLYGFDYKKACCTQNDFDFTKLD